MGLRTFLVLLGAVAGLLAAEADTSKKIVGTWQLAGQPGITWTFRGDGTMTDTSAGTWRLFTDKDRDPLLDSVVSGVTYLRIEVRGEITFYAVVRANRRHLDLRHTDRRGTLLRFTRQR